jgi:hypothetical protein
VSYPAIERRKRGRPRVTPGESTELLSLRICQSQHDDVCILALRSNRSVAGVVRDAIAKLLNDERGGVLRIP